jgi:hypothetical protein
LSNAIDKAQRNGRLYGEIGFFYFQEFSPRKPGPAMESEKDWFLPFRSWRLGCVQRLFVCLLQSLLCAKEELLFCIPNHQVRIPELLARCFLGFPENVAISWIFRLLLPGASARSVFIQLT